MVNTMIDDVKEIRKLRFEKISECIDNYALLNKELENGNLLAILADIILYCNVMNINLSVISQAASNADAFFEMIYNENLENN